MDILGYDIQKENFEESLEDCTGCPFAFMCDAPELMLLESLQEGRTIEQARAYIANRDPEHTDPRAVKFTNRVLDWIEAQPKPDN